MKTGEEDEECILKMRAKMYRHREEWKERGIGNLRLLRHKETKKIRFVMRQEKTHKVCANHIVTCQAPFCTLTNMAN